MQYLFYKQLNAKLNVQSMTSMMKQLFKFQQEFQNTQKKKKMDSTKELDIDNSIRKLSISQNNNQQLEQIVSGQVIRQETKQQSPDIMVPYKVITGHWMTISRPQYKRTCGISSLVSLWNFQFSKLGMGNKDPISVQQAMLKLNLIGNGSIEENMRKKFKKTAELTEKPDSSNDPTNEQAKLLQQKEDAQIRNNKMCLDEYINTIDFGCFTGNDTLLKWYRLLCRIYGGSGRSYIFYKTNSDRSVHKSEQSARKSLIQGLNSNGKTCFIYHAYDHYFCPVGYQFVPKNDENDDGTFNTSELKQQGNQLYVMIGQSSKMFPCMHVVKWSQINQDLNTYWPQFYNIRRRKEGVQFYKGKQSQSFKDSTIDCIMAFEKIKD